MKIIKKINNSLAAEPPGGTKPNPLAPATTPLDSIGWSLGGMGKTTGPIENDVIISTFKINFKSHIWHSMN